MSNARGEGHHTWLRYQVIEGFHENYTPKWSSEHTHSLYFPIPGGCSKYWDANSLSVNDSEVESVVYNRVDVNSLNI